MTPLERLKGLVAAFATAPQDDRGLRAEEVFDAYWRLTRTERLMLQDDDVASDLMRALTWGRPHLPGAYYTRRGYRLDECLQAVGSGWEDLVRRAWRTVRDASATIVQVKEKLGGLVVYVRLPEASTPEDVKPLRMALDAINGESRTTCEACGGHGRLWTPATAPSPIDPARRPRTRRKTLCEPHAFAFYAEGLSLEEIAE
jgi:hypothetical protein